jgi:hypothetical protein
MKRAPLIAVTMAVAYFLLAFNAYACLIPLYGGVQVATGSDCSMPQEQPARQHCDAFKTVGVQSVSSLLPLPDVSHGFDTTLVSILFLRPAAVSHFYIEHGPQRSPDNLLALTSVLRI